MTVKHRRQLYLSILFWLPCLNNDGCLGHEHLFTRTLYSPSLDAVDSVNERELEA